jgi:hypothetical protein
MGWVYNSGPQEYSEAEKFLLTGDIVADWWYYSSLNIVA